MGELLAYEVRIDGMRGIVFAESHAKARYIAALAYWDAGWCSRKVWPRIKSFRVPRYDGHPAAQRGPRAWSHEYLDEAGV